MSLAAFGRLHPNYPTDLVPGVDVSGHQSPGQLATALQWAKWCYIKATESVTFYEPDTTAAHVAVANQYRAPYGFYHFARPERGNDPRAEAGWFATAVMRQGGPGRLPPVLDLESQVSGDQSGWAVAFLDEVQRLLGRQPMFYSYAGWISTHLSLPELARYPLWLAHYAPAGVDAWVPRPWSDWAVWQYQSLTPEHGSLDLNVARPDWLRSIAVAADDGFTDADRQLLRDFTAAVA